MGQWRKIFSCHANQSKVPKDNKNKSIKALNIYFIIINMKMKYILFFAIKLVC